MRTRKVQTRFMNGNIDIDNVIYDLLIDEYGHGAVYSSDFDTDNAIYSDGFIRAIENGKVPMLKLSPLDSKWFYNENEEYHHVIINNECYNVHFK